MTLLKHRTSTLSKNITVQGRDISMLGKDPHLALTEDCPGNHTKRCKKELLAVLESRATRTGFPSSWEVDQIPALNNKNSNNHNNDDYHDGDDNNSSSSKKKKKNHNERRNSRFFTISSLRREPSPTRTLNWPERNRVQITCNKSSAYHVQHVLLRATWYKGTAQLLNLTELKSHLLELYFIG